MKTKEIIMKNKTKTKVKKTNFIGLVGMLLIGFAIIDFAMSWMGTNLTAFLGPVSKFSAMITGFIGISLLNAGNAELEDR
jgi:hypothetical protein